MAIRFTKDEKQFIRDNYPNIGAIGVSFLLPSHSYDSVKAWAHRNGVKVSKAYRTAVAVRVNKSWVRSEETRKHIGDGHRKHAPFRCEKCSKPIAHYKKLCWSCYVKQCKGEGNNNWRGGVTTLTNT